MGVWLWAADLRGLPELAHGTESPDLGMCNAGHRLFQFLNSQRSGFRTVFASRLHENQGFKQGLLACHEIGEKRVPAAGTDGAIGNTCRNGAEVALLLMLAMKVRQNHAHGIVDHVLERLGLPEGGFDWFNTQQCIPTPVYFRALRFKGVKHPFFHEQSMLQHLRGRCARVVQAFASFVHVQLKNK